MRNIGSRGDEEDLKRLTEFIDRLEKNDVTFQLLKYDVSSAAQMMNACLSRCYSCEGFAIWIKDRLVFPETDFGIVAHDEMPRDVREDFEEAASIVARSPRGAAALLRLCVQKLVISLEGIGTNLNHDIGELVRKGAIDTRIQQALDLVRVVGNNAVHPGQIDLNDNSEIAVDLFDLVNLIVETAIAGPKHISAMYERIIPETARAQIDKRNVAGDKKSN
jgi:hypothetical protein